MPPCPSGTTRSDRNCEVVPAQSLSSDAIGDQEPWWLWLESMRKRKWRGLHVTGNCPVSKLVWESGVNVGRPPVAVRRELGLSTPDEPDAYHWLEDLALDNVFRESADFCEDLACVVGLITPSTRATGIAAGPMAGIPKLSKSFKGVLHESFEEWRDCISDLALKEKENLLLGGPNAWMRGPVRGLREFEISAGLNALRRVWDRLPEFKEKGKDAIEGFLRPIG